MHLVATLGSGTFAMENTIYRMKAKLREREQPRPLIELAMDHRLAVFGTAVSVAVLGAGYRIMQNKNTNGAQKFMNIRLYGQMAGLAAIIALMGLSAAKKTIPNEGDHKPQK